MRSSLWAALLAIGIPAACYFWKLPAARLSDSERGLISFYQTTPVLPPPRPRVSFAGLVCPVRVTPASGPGRSAANEFRPGPLPAAPAAPLRRAAPRRNSYDGRPNVSMIYFDNSNKTAIINGEILHEGSTFGRGLIVRIEKTRVLLRIDQKDIWLGIYQ